MKFDFDYHQYCTCSWYTVSNRYRYNYKYTIAVGVSLHKLFELAQVISCKLFCSLKDVSTGDIRDSYSVVTQTKKKSEVIFNLPLPSCDQLEMWVTPVCQIGLQPVNGG